MIDSTGQYLSVGDYIVANDEPDRMWIIDCLENRYQNCGEDETGAMSVKSLSGLIKMGIHSSRLTKLSESEAMLRTLEL